VDLARLQAAGSKPESLRAVVVEPGVTSIGRYGPLDSLDQAQLVAQLRNTNLLWCGAGLQALKASCPPGIGLVGLSFPSPPEVWLCDTQMTMEHVARDQFREIETITNLALGKTLWLGGFSLQAWVTYALAQLMLEQGVAVAGVILLDPPDPFTSRLRWGWRRQLADQWRRQWKGKSKPERWFRQRAWNQQLIGCWQPRPIEAELMLFRSRYGRRLPIRRARWLQPKLTWKDLTGAHHGDVLQDPNVVRIWQAEIWQRIVSSDPSRT
jgi:hypothetical protein